MVTISESEGSIFRMTPSFLISVSGIQSLSIHIKTVSAMNEQDTHNNYKNTELQLTILFDNIYSINLKKTDNHNRYGIMHIYLFLYFTLLVLYIICL
jgi:hypothetical protein